MENGKTLNSINRIKYIEKFTLITAASSGLGKELAMLYAIDNNNLLLVATNETN